MSSSRECAGRLLQTRGPAAAKLLSPNVLWVRGTAHDLSVDERSRRRGPSETRCMSSARYGGAWPDKDEKTKHASLKSTRLWTGSFSKMIVTFSKLGRRWSDGLKLLILSLYALTLRDLAWGMIPHHIFVGAPKNEADKLQRVLNAAARIVSGTRKYDHDLTDLMHNELHWLDVPDRVKYKLGMLMYRCQHNQAPRYLLLASL